MYIVYIKTKIENSHKAIKNNNIMRKNVHVCVEEIRDH